MSAELDLEELKVTSRQLAQRLYESGFGEWGPDGGLRLEPYEALYLASKGRVRLLQGGREVEFDRAAQYFLKRDPRVWLKYTIFSDLRNRGYIVKRGFTERVVEFRVYERGDKPGQRPAKYIVRVLQEGESLDVGRLLDMIHYARRLRKDLVLAIVDSQGDVVYYQASQVEL